MPKTHVIAAVCAEKPGFVLFIELEDLMDRSLDGTVDAVRGAVKDWSGTDAGRRFTRGTYGVIDWGDFVNEIPPCVCERHGFAIKRTAVSDRMVGHGENLLVD